MKRLQEKIAGFFYSIYTYFLVESNGENSLIEKEKSVNAKSLLKLINFISVLLVAFFIPLDNLVLRYLIGLWILTWIVELIVIPKNQYKLVSRSEKAILFLPILFYLIHILSYFNSTNKAVAGFDLEVKLSILLFPILALRLNNLYFRHKIWIFRAFVFGLFSSSLICLIIAFLNSISVINNVVLFNFSALKGLEGINFIELLRARFSTFSYSHLSFFHHPTYFALYLNMGIIFSYYLLRFGNVRLRWFYIFAMFLFSVMVFLLASRAGLITLLLLLITLSIIELLRGKYYYVPFFIFVMAFLIYNGVKSKLISHNISEVFQLIEEGKFTIDENSDVRFKLWVNASELSRKHVWFGFGIGDYKEKLLQQYKKNGLEKAFVNKYNVHNQYIESLLGGGLIMLFSLIAMLLGALWYAIKNNQTSLFVMIILLIINFAFESMLKTMSGVIFTMLFYSLLVRIKFVTSAKSLISRD